MKQGLLKLSAIVLFVTLLSVTANAQGNILVKFTDGNGGVLNMGSSTLTGYIGQSEITSFGQENTLCTTAGNCPPTIGNFILNMYQDATYTLLQRGLLTKIPFTKVEITFLQINGGTLRPYYKIELEEAVFTGLQTSANDGDRPMIQLKMDPRKIKWTYISYPNSGPATTRTIGWDKTTNQIF